MKFYSEDTKKFYDTATECDAAEKEYAKEQEMLKKAEAEKSASMSKEKKALSDRIEAADAVLNAALEDYKQAKEDNKKLFSDAYEGAEAILREASNAIKAAQKAKYDAVAEFNKKFGAYSVRYNGERAQKELDKVNSWISDWFSDLWHPFI